MISDFERWLHRYAAAAHLNAAELARERTVLVNGVVCAFIEGMPNPRGAEIIVLLDSGGLRFPEDDDLFKSAMSRNAENFLMGAPLFLFNAESQRLLVAQRFAHTELEPAAFVQVLEALSRQALAWRRREA